MTDITVNAGGCLLVGILDAEGSALYLALEAAFDTAHGNSADRLYRMGAHDMLYWLVKREDVRACLERARWNLEMGLK